MTAQCFGRYFTFGKLKTNLNMWFTWADSFQKAKKVQTQNISLDTYSALYNYAVCMARIGILSDLSGDGIKIASASLCKAASTFDYLKTACNQLQPAEVSPDLQSQTLDQNRDLCLGQAQYLFYKMAKDKGMKASLLSQIAMQSSIYFREAHEKNMMSQPLRQFENGAFSAKLGYHACYFEAIAFYEQGAFLYK
jgi:hypothetical protein